MKLLLRTTLLALIGLWVLNAPAQQILITELKDIDAGTVPPTVGDIKVSASLCVVLDQQGTYQLTATGDGLASAFEVRSGPYSIPYAAAYTDKKKPGAFDPLVPGLSLGGLRVRQNNNGTCRKDNATVEVLFAAADLMSAAGGYYSGTLTLMVSPE